METITSLNQYITLLHQDQYEYIDLSLVSIFFVDCLDIIKEYSDILHTIEDININESNRNSTLNFISKSLSLSQCFSLLFLRKISSLSFIHIKMSQEQSVHLDYLLYVYLTRCFSSDDLWIQFWDYITSFDFIII